MYKSGNHKIQECIINIDLLCMGIYHSYEEVMGLNLTSESLVYKDIVRYRYIQLCSILDEIEILHSLANSDNYLKDTLYVISPIVKALRQYTGLKKARNYMFAHYNRDKKKQFYPWWIALRNLKLPTKPTELTDIYKHLLMINTILVTRYYDDLNDIIERTLPDYDLYVEESKKMADDNDTESVFDKTMEEVAQKATDKGLDDDIMSEQVINDINVRLNRNKESVERNLEIQKSKQAPANSGFTK